MSVRKKLIIFIAALLVLDQAVKIWIKTHMMIWGRIHGLQLV